MIADNPICLFLPAAGCVQVTINLKTLSVGDIIGEDCVLGFETRQYQVRDCQPNVQMKIRQRRTSIIVGSISQ